jgi:hypothetical protein
VGNFCLLREWGRIDAIQPTDFERDVAVARSRASVAIPHELARSFVSICGHLRDQRLSFALQE